MSLPLTRRIAQAALIVAAGATPLVAAGAASASQLVPQGTDLGAGVTQLADLPDSASTVQGAAHQLGQAAGTTGATTVAMGVPAAADATGATLANALPNTHAAAPAGKTTAVMGAVSTLADRLTPAVTDKVSPAVADKLSPALSGRILPAVGSTRSASAGANPLGGLPVGGLTNGLPGGALAPVTGPITGAAKSLPGASALAPLTGAHESADRLGGMPALGGTDLGHNNPLSSVTGALGPVGGLLGGLNGGGLGLPL
jgi:hypothetical protein